jgi:NhaA family Na+:H+ antiporter
MWFCVLESGIHATLAGIALAFAIPIRGNALPDGHVNSPLKRLEHAIQPYVAFGIVPLFALLNAGISFAGVRPSILASLLPLGIIAGLFLGKQAGIFAFSYLAIKLRIGSLPKGTSWSTLYGISVLGGIGFTMSLFIGGLAFASPELLTQMKIGVLAGSLLSAAAGTAVLRLSALRARRDASPAA